MVYKWYILPIGRLYATYHLLGEPEATIDKRVVFKYREMICQCVVHIPDLPDVRVFLLADKASQVPEGKSTWHRPQKVG